MRKCDQCGGELHSYDSLTEHYTLTRCTENLRAEIKRLQADIERLRDLCDPAVLAEDDRKLKEKAVAEAAKYDTRRYRKEVVDGE